MASAAPPDPGGGVSPMSDQAASTPSRRRLIKPSMRSYSEDTSTRKREGVTASASTPPGFVGPAISDRAQNSSVSPSSAVGLGATSALAAPILTGNATPGFRERDRGPARSNSKELLGDHQSSLPHGGASSAAKPGRSQHMSSPGVTEARPLGRRADGIRRHDSSPAQKHGEDMRLQQAKRAALMKAQQAGATGNFRSFDSPFGNFLVPVVPLQFLSKSQLQGSDMGGPSIVTSTPAGSGR